MKYTWLVLAIVLMPAWLFAQGAILINDTIEEASGIVYHKSRNTLFVVDDEGLIFELTLDGKIINQKYLGDFDLEGVTTGQNVNELIVAVEGVERILFVDANSLVVKRNINIDRTWDNCEILIPDKSHGIEGIHNFNGHLLLVNQSYNLKSKQDPSILFEIREDIDMQEFYIYSITYLPFPDLAGITEKDGLLYLLSDDENLILAHDKEKNEVVNQFNITISGDQEGLTFDSAGNLYIAIDGRGVFKTKL